MDAKIHLQMNEIIVTAVAVMPLSLIIWASGHFTPFGWMMVLQSLRLVKIQPLIAFWEWAKMYHLNVVMLFQGVFLYYVAAHYFSCIMIGIAIHKEDHRDSWLRKLPQP